MMMKQLDADGVLLYEDEGIPRFSCKVCGAYGFAEFRYEQIGVCGECVRSLAHEYLMKHTGEPDHRFALEGFYERYHQQRRSKVYKKKPIPHGLRKAVLERDKYRCRECGDHRSLHVDHVFPESLGGEASIENLQCLCATCNVKKGARI